MDSTASRLQLSVVATIALLAVGSAAILIRWCTAPAIAIAFYRVFVAALMVWAMLFASRGMRRLFAVDRRQLLLCCLSGFSLAVHFTTWIYSLEMTSVTNSVVLVCTSPFFVALGARIFYGASIHRLFLLGLLLAFVGALLISLTPGADESGKSMQGNLLALAGAIAGAGYLLTGRAVRRDIDNLAYIGLTYTASSVCLVIAMLATGTPFGGYSSDTVLLLLAIGLLPQLIGHSSFNWMLKHLSAQLVALLFLGEPVIAAFLAWLLLGELQSLQQLFGALTVISGVALAIKAESIQQEKLNS